MIKQIRFWGVISLCLLSNNMLGQSSYSIISPKLFKEDMYIVDTIEIKNPIAFRIRGNKNAPVMICDASEIESIKKHRKKNSYFNYPLFLFNSQFSDLLGTQTQSVEELEDVNCAYFEFDDTPNKVNGYILKKLSIKTTHFIICFVRTEAFFNVFGESNIAVISKYIRIIVPVNCGSEGSVPN